jgi:hypothetical protein
VEPTSTLVVPGSTGAVGHSSERGLVAGDGSFVLGAAVDVVEHAAGQTSFGDPAKVSDGRGASEPSFDRVGLDRLEPDDGPEGLLRVHDGSYLFRAGEARSVRLRERARTSAHRNPD